MGRRLGQHFLASAKLAERLVNFMEAASEREVLELGSGSGILTAELAKRYRKVVTLELDKDVMEGAEAKLSERSNITWVHGDMMEFDPTQFMRSHSLLITNLPYQIAGPMMAKIATWGDTFDYAWLMLQREVAERLVASPHSRKRSRLTVLMELRCPAQILLKLSPGAFRPPPQVESAFVKLTFLPTAPNINWLDLQELLRIAFAVRRKKVYAAVASWAHREKQEIYQEMAQLGVDPNARPEDLTRVDWLNLIGLERFQ